MKINSYIIQCPKTKKFVGPLRLGRKLTTLNNAKLYASEGLAKTAMKLRWDTEDKGFTIKQVEIKLID